MAFSSGGLRVIGLGDEVGSRWNGLRIMSNFRLAAGARMRTPGRTSSGRSRKSDSFIRVVRENIPFPGCRSTYQIVGRAGETERQADLIGKLLPTRSDTNQISLDDIETGIIRQPDADLRTAADHVSIRSRAPADDIVVRIRMPP